jgi:hypothetical protein
MPNPKFDIFERTDHHHWLLICPLSIHQIRNSQTLIVTHMALTESGRAALKAR